MNQNKLGHEAIKKGSSATDFVTNLTDFTEVNQKETAIRKSRNLPFGRYNP
ncbi:MAG: hypothetical protein QQW96_10030 [Tychonema bourrellyi B0820]|nr:hypothetical protein [Tychonema bourrellyi B0820]